MTNLLGRIPALTLALVAFQAATAAAQFAEFDPDRAWIPDPGMFEPFVVDQTIPLAAAADAGDVEGSTWLLVVDHPAGRLALITDQMAYHHVAQGSLRGIPWMVSF